MAILALRSRRDKGGAEKYLAKLMVVATEKSQLFDKYGKLGVQRLAAATPIDTGLTAASWSYKVVVTNEGYDLEFHNDNMGGDRPVVILLRFGHGLASGGYVKGNDFVKPVIQELMEELTNELEKEVKNA